MAFDVLGFSTDWGRCGEWSLKKNGSNLSRLSNGHSCRQWRFSCGAVFCLKLHTEVKQEAWLAVVEFCFSEQIILNRGKWAVF